ncbi:MAG: PilW family protein [Solirubrobacterales bacterium]
MPLTPRLKNARTALGAEHGFTLVELLVAMAAGIVVSSALFTILDVTLEQTTRTFSRVDATQRARTALETIENEMHSGCVENSVTPIRTGSSATSVEFLSQYGNGVNLTPVVHKVSFDSSTGKLTDETYAVTGTAPQWGREATPTSTKTLLTNVAESPGTPVFQYFSLDPSVASPLPAPLDYKEAGTTTEVRITLVVKPAGGSHQDTNLVANTVTNSVLLRLTPIPNPGTPNQDFNPCE